jgi:multisubunit Na+/H+ antiporter MnhE subunit
MKRITLNYLLSGVLFLSILITALLGYIQSELELRKFIPHRYSAYLTLILLFIHIIQNGSKVIRYFLGRKGNPSLGKKTDQSRISGK